MRTLLIIIEFICVFFALFYFVKFMLIPIEKELIELRKRNIRKEKQIANLHRRINEIEKYGKN